jgi:FixJ family two-component response regulator
MLNRLSRNLLIIESANEKIEIMGTLIFVVEDDPGFNKLITQFLLSKNIGIVKSFLSGEDCLEKLCEQPDMILIDYELPAKNGIEMMREVKKRFPKTGCIFLSGQSDVKVGIEAMKEGAFDYIVKDQNARQNTWNKINEFIKLRDSGKNGETEIKIDSSFYF